MTRQEFTEYIKKYGPVILDGATGTNLMAAGMPVGVCPEAWILEHPQAMRDLQKAYIEAGSDILYAPTFTGNRVKLAEYGLENRLEEINTQLVKLSCQVAEDSGRGKGSSRPVLVAGDMTMCGRQLYPMGDLLFEELVEVYKEQAKVIAQAGADLFVVETMMSLQECRAAVLAIREVCDLPVMVSLTFNEDGRTLYGTPPESAVVVLQALGADVIGVNCSTGPEEMIPLVEKMLACSTVPILAKPNAGLPELEGRKTVYRMTAASFAEAGAGLVQAGAALVGGCCGTTPEHIRTLKQTVSTLPVRENLSSHRRMLSSERKTVEIDPTGNFMVVGERINPTGKKKLQAALREGNLDLVREMALEQEKNGARILDINMGMNGINEKDMMQQVIYEVTSTVDCPLCIDTSYVDVMEAALRIYPGRALINSISMETEKMQKLLPVARKYGAMFILLPLSDHGLPKSIDEKKDIIERVYQKALSLGMSHEDIVVDGLVATIGANPQAALECFETISYCRERDLPTICGLSNISFGLPERSYVNTAFLTMAISKGLTMAIANPSQELLMNAAFASDLLLAKLESDLRYISRMEDVVKAHKEQEAVAKGKMKAELIREGYTVKTAAGSEADRPDSCGGGPGVSEQEPIVVRGGMEVERGAIRGKIEKQLSAPESGEGAAESVTIHPVFQAVLKGNKNSIVGLVKEEYDRGMTPERIINSFLIPAINEVGDLFNRKKYYLPQLIASANAMKLAIDYLEPRMEKKETGEKLPVIVIATVEGDIHDIGKNLVALMLKNYGYQVIDMGKDVPCEAIVDKAMETGAAIIALSALMTTTMMRMQDVVDLCREKGCLAQVIIGGACITQSFAEEIGADGYSKDAADCVKLVERLLARDCA